MYTSLREFDFKCIHHNLSSLVKSVRTWVAVQGNEAWSGQRLFHLPPLPAHLQTRFPRLKLMNPPPLPSLLWLIPLPPIKRTLLQIDLQRRNVKHRKGAIAVTLANMRSMGEVFVIEISMLSLFYPLKMMILRKKRVWDAIREAWIRFFKHF